MEENYYIVNDELGLFVGEFAGLGIWTLTNIAQEIPPSSWNDYISAKAYLETWNIDEESRKEFRVEKLNSKQVKEIIVKFTRAN